MTIIAPRAGPQLLEPALPAPIAAYPPAPGSPTFDGRTPRGGPFRDYERPGTVTFFLTAPFKPAVHLTGDFNGWNPYSHPMLTDHQGHFWLTLPLQGPVEYRFAVTMDDSGRQVRCADPYAREIRWDAAGPKAYLSDEPAFRWTDAAWQRPPLRDLIIYEISVRDFAGSKRNYVDHFGTFAGIREKLDYLQDLGVNALELMPVSEFPGRSSWGYNPIFYTAPKWLYGSPNALKALVDAAHARGLAVILDMVFNHAWSDHPYYQMYPPLFAPDGEKLPDFNPFFHHHNNGHANSWGGLDWDHTSPYTTAYMQDIVRFWLQEYHVDGFRFDWLGGVEYDPWQPHKDGFDPFTGIGPIARAARDCAPTCYQIGEYWPINGTNPAKTSARLVAQTEIDAVWNGNFHHTLENCLTQTWQWELQNLPHALGGFRGDGFTRADQVVNYVVSHDERRPEHEIQFWGAHIQPEDPADAAAYPTRWTLALAKARLGLAALLTSPGVPMLLQGQEFGEDSPRTIEFWPLDWKKLHRPEGRRQLACYRRLIRLRRAHPALRSDHVEYYWDDFPRDRVVRYKRWDGAGDVVVVALNFHNRRQQTGLGFPHDGLWREVITNRLHRITGNWRDITLPAWTARVFVPV